MFGFFRKSKAASAPVVEPEPQPAKEALEAPGTKIRYDPQLIDKFKNDHHQLLGLFGGIKSAFDAGNYALVAENLDKFRSGLQAHLLVENVRLYIYLEHMLAGDETSYELVHGFRREMEGIGRVAVAFLTKYKMIGVDKDLAESFGRELDGIGKVLVDRITREEETLYPLYLPAY